MRKPISPPTRATHRSSTPKGYLSHQGQHMRSNPSPKKSYYQSWENITDQMAAIAKQYTDIETSVDTSLPDDVRSKEIKALKDAWLKTNLEISLDKLLKAQANIAKRYPYMQIHLASLTPKVTFQVKDRPDANAVQYAATDNLRIYFNAAFVQALTLQELTFLYMHELMHVCFGHFHRKKWTDLTNRQKSN